MDTNEGQQPASSAAPDCSAFVSDLYTRWCESAPYGEQVPDELGKLFSEFCTEHRGKTADEMFQAFMEVSPDDPMEQLFACIFETGARFAMDRLSDAVYDQNAEVLRLIDLELVGTLSTPENDPHPSCPAQHILHPANGGLAVFAKAVRLRMTPVMPNSQLNKPSA